MTRPRARVVVTTEARLLRAPDGTHTSDTGGRGYDFWRRYLDAFDEVVVVARVEEVPAAVGSPVDGPGVVVAGLRDYKGLKGTITALPALARQTASVSARRGTFLLRVPSTIGSFVALWLAVRRKPFALEVVGDPADVFASGVGGRIAPFAERASFRLLRWLCRRAAAVSYVTEGALQRRYPPSRSALVTSYSSVELPTAAFTSEARDPASSCEVMRIVNVGTMSQVYKGQDLLISAVSDLVADGHDIELTLVGDGVLQSALAEQARQMGIAGRVYFAGLVPSGAPVRELLDGADLYVLSSRTEGLPRALIEAMARGLPCIGADVGGVSELIPERALFTPDDEKAMAASIRELLQDRVWRGRLAHHCWQRASDYRNEILQAKRIRFLEELRTKTEEFS